MARALPTWLGLTVVAGVVMGGNGMSARDVVAVASAPRPMVVLGLAWLLLSVASVRAAFGGGGVAYLRSLPGGGAWNVVAVVAMALVAHLPWGLLWSIGAGPMKGAAAWGAMATLSLLVVGAGVRVAQRPRAVPAWRSPWRALVGVLVRGLTRKRASALIAGAGVAAIGGAFAALVIGHEARDAHDAAIIAGTCAALAVSGALIAATAAIAEADRQVAWLAGAAAVPVGTRRLASAAVLGTIGVMAGLVATAAARAVAPLSTELLGAVAAAHVMVGLGSGLGAVEIAARSKRDDGDRAGTQRGEGANHLGAGDGGAGGRIDGGRIVAGMLVLGVIALVAIASLRGGGLVAFVAVGAGIAAGGGQRT
jgi:hypothetical protein